MNRYARRIIPTRRGLIRIVARSRATRRFYIGRTTDPQGRGGQHDADKFYILYKTTSIARAIAVERALIQYFIRHPKCTNRASDARGPVIRGWQYVYLAVWT